MPVGQGQPVVALAAHVCLNCKARKRKCNKALPSCALCSKCHYAPVGSSAADIYNGAVHEQKTSDRNNYVQNWQGSSTFLTVFSLKDPLTSSVQESVAMKEALNVLAANSTTATMVVAEYTKSINNWFPPIVSLANLYTRLQRESSSKLAVLLLAMHLVTHIPTQQGTVYTSTYFKTKSLLSSVVSSGDSSLEVVQASVLVTLYEAGHGMADAAQVSMAISSRIGHRLFSRKRRVEGDKIGGTEEGRVWWSINILDRFMNLGVHADEIHFATMKPSDCPCTVGYAVDDDERELSALYHRSTLVADAPSRLSSFFHSTMLLGLVLEYVQDLDAGKPLDSARCRRLDISLQSLLMDMLNNAVTGQKECCESIGLCLSALLTLHRAQYDAAGSQIACDMPAYTNQRQIASMAIKSVVNMSVDIAAKMFSEFVYEEMGMLALPSTFAVYHAAVLHTQFAGDNFGSAEWETAMQTLKRMLGVYGSRWSIGKRYLDIIEATTTKAARSHATQPAPHP